MPINRGDAPREVAAARERGDPLHFVLRVSDGLRGVDTYEEHADILRRKGRVWWAKWGLGIGKWAVDLANDQIERKSPTFVYLRFGNRTRFRATIAAVEGGGFKSTYAAPQPTLVPAYYRDDECGVWFLMTKIDPCDEEEARRLRKFLSPSEPPQFIGQRGIYFVTIPTD